jgi:hypothetical protein
MIINAINSIPSPLLQILNTHIVDITLATILIIVIINNGNNVIFSVKRIVLLLHIVFRGPGHDLDLGRVHDLGHGLGHVHGLDRMVLTTILILVMVVVIAI